jgi:adenine-specific DNA-methyltransferase
MAFVEQPELGCGASRRSRLIQGDNLAVMSALLPEFGGRFACAYLDPPYNTGQRRADAYDDRLSRAGWAAMIGSRLAALRPLMRPDGVVFVQIDDRQLFDLKALLDQAFGGAQMLSLITVKMSELSGVKMAHAERRLPKVKEHILVYGVSPSSRLANLRVPKSAGSLERYRRYYTKIIVDPSIDAANWEVVTLAAYAARRGMPSDAAALDKLRFAEAHRVVYRTNNALLGRLALPGIQRVTSPTGVEYISWDGKQMLFLADHLSEALGDLWTDLSTINLNKEGGVAFPGSKKPEALIERCLALASASGDWVIDPFAGSGTTAAVALKTGRHFVTIEAGEHAETHAAVRLRNIALDGPDGFRFERLA